MDYQEGLMNKQVFSRDEVLGLFASLLLCEQAYEYDEDVIDFLKQMGINTESGDPYEILWELHFEGIRYPNGDPLIDPESIEEFENAIRNEEEKRQADSVSKP
jgi:hypothetical protein